MDPDGLDVLAGAAAFGRLVHVVVDDLCEEEVCRPDVVLSLLLLFLHVYIFHLKLKLMLVLALAVQARV